MSPLVIGLLFGAGVFCIYWSFWPAPEAIRPRRRSGFRVRLQDNLAQAGYASVTPTNIVGGSAALFALVFLAGMVSIRVVPIALCFAGIAGGMPLTLVRMRARSRRNKLRDLWPDAVDNITSGVRAGLALPEALAQLAIRGPEELRPAFAAFAEDYRATGRFHYCLDRLKERLSDPVADRLVESLRLAREVGGSDLGRLLRTLSAFLRQDARTRAELETRQGWTVSAARLAIAAPWIVLGMLALRGESLTAYARPAGWAILFAGAAVCLVAYRLMVRIGRLADEQRVLR